MGSHRIRHAAPIPIPIQLPVWNNGGGVGLAAAADGGQERYYNGGGSSASGVGRSMMSVPWGRFHLELAALLPAIAFCGENAQTFDSRTLEQVCRSRL
jgi:hypothetical protein